MTSLVRGFLRRRALLQRSKLRGALPQVSELRWDKGKNNCAGNVWWLYDPKSGHTACLASEEEVRMWIEESF
ncbi:hypothetical protein [Nostoc sp. 106C]|uniref:hypothetical protein n=1 Tax=Nostoc sp. 106C TaxID=1932667 RepID=UPI00117F3B09|nr:hypothetical protein [Nostoc sp. 106C]